MVIRAGGNLRQVRHGEYLSVRAELTHQAAHSFCHGTAYTCVNLIKYQSLRTAQLTGGNRNRKRNSGQLTA
jgi:hypothetical protein